MEGDEEDETTVEEESDEPEYLLCPVCAEKGKEVGFINMQKMSSHYNWQHKHESDPPWAEVKPNIVRTTKKPQNLIDADKPKSKKPSKSKPKGVKMSSEADEERIAPELGDAAHVRGTIKQLLVKLGKLPKDERDALLPEREELMEYMKTLTLKDLSIDVIREIEAKLELDIMPKVTSLTGDVAKAVDAGSDDGESSDEISIDVRMKKEQLRSNIKKDLQTIADLPSDVSESLSVEREILVELNRKLVKDDISKKALREMEAQLTSFRPFIESAKKKAGKKKGRKDEDWYDDEDDDDDADRDSLKRVKQRLKRTQYLRDLKEEQLALDKLNEKENQPQQGQIQMVPITRPKIDPQTGQIMVGEDGNPITETTYQYATQTGMDPLMQTMFQTLMMTMINQGKGGDDTMMKMMMEMKKEEYEWRRHQLEMELKRAENNPANEEIKELRSMNQQMQNQFFQSQMNQMQNQLNNARAAAGRDQLSELLEEKQRLIELGLVSDPGMSSQQAKSEQYAREVLNEASGKLDRTTHDLKELAQPFVDMNAQIMRRRLEKMDDEEERQSSGGSSTEPPPLTQDEQKRKWNNILHHIDETQEAG